MHGGAFVAVTLLLLFGRLQSADLPPCPTPRRWACYANEWLERQGLPRYPLPEPDDKSGAPCIHPVVVNYKGANISILFPHNLCTRERLAADNCPKILPDYNARTPMLSTDYVAQCDTGYAVPAAIAEKNRGGQCIDNLGDAAGFEEYETSPFPDEMPSWDVIEVKFCDLQEAPGEKRMCVAPPMCDQRLRSGVPSKDILPHCHQPCVYNVSPNQYRDCQPLDLRIGESHQARVIAGYRQKSSPHATLMTRAENLKLLPRSADERAYPRCIRAEKLTVTQQAIIRNDFFLNCETNPYYKRNNQDPELYIEPVDCGPDESPSEIFCIPSTTTKTSNQLKNTDNPLSDLPPIIMVGLGFGPGIVVGAVLQCLVCCLCFRRLSNKQDTKNAPPHPPEAPESPQTPETPLRSAEAIMVGVGDDFKTLEPPSTDAIPTITDQDFAVPRQASKSNLDSSMPKHQKYEKTEEYGAVPTLEPVGEPLHTQPPRDASKSRSRHTDPAELEKPAAVKRTAISKSGGGKVKSGNDASGSRRPKKPRARFGNKVELLAEQERMMDEMDSVE
ncbi:unnamed protein product, partial [Mesorhabditis spiculigera]